MKPMLLLLLPLFLLSSCVQYQYVTLEGVNIPRNSQNELISENDTLKVLYLFTPGQISVRVYNKLAEPLEVVWNKSALVLNDQAVGYYNPNQTFAGRIQTDSWRVHRTTSTTGEVRGELQGSEQVQFVPPLSYIESRPLEIPVKPLLNLPEEKAQKAYLFAGTSHEGAVQYKRFPFGKETSPAQFRSYLTFRTGRDVAAKEFFIEHRFFVSEIWKSHSGPDYFTSELVNRGDRFYFLTY